MISRKSERLEGDSVPIELSVVIPMLNAASTIEAQLEALLRQEWSAGWEVVVADNGSTDESREIVTNISRRDPRIRLIDAGGARGPSAARNEGVSRSRGTSVVFCDADDAVCAGWVAAMGAALRSAEAVAGPQSQDLLNPPWLRNVYGSRLATAGQTFAGVFPFGASANLGVRKDLFQQLGGFDPALQVGEDIEFCLRLWKAGHRLEFVPEAVTEYRNRSSMRALFVQAVRYGAAGPMVVSRLRQLGGDIPHPWRGMSNWLWLMRKLPTLRSKAGQARWLVVAGGSLGRLLGSVRQRTVYL